jgi:hypothetical protein
MPTTATAIQTPTATTGQVSPGLQSIDGKQLPGTVSSDWLQLHQQTPPSPATDMEQTSSKDARYHIALFSFSSHADAATFYGSPPTAIHGFIPGVLGYPRLGGSTQVPPPSWAVDLRSCAGEGSGPSYDPSSGVCSNGGASFSIGVGMLIQRGNVVVFVGHLNDPTNPDATPADLVKIRPFAEDALSLLSAAGLGH